MSDNVLNRLSAVLTIICSIGSIVSYLMNSSSAIIIPFFGFTVTFALIWLLVKNPATNFRAIFNSLSNVDEAPYREDYELLYHKTIIDINERDGSNSTCHQTNKIKCLTTASNQYYFRYAPADHYSDFTFSPGIIKSIDKRANGTDIIVQFDRPCRMNEIKDISITSKLIGLLTDSKEFWCVQKYYKSTKGHILEIRYPANVEPSSHEAEIVKNDMYIKARPTKNEVTKQIINGRVILTIQTDELKIGEKLRLKWVW